MNNNKHYIFQYLGLENFTSKSYSQKVTQQEY